MSLFSSIFGSPWALHRMGSYAIRTRLRSPNTLFHFRTASKKQLPKEVTLGPFWVNFPLKLRFWVKKSRPKQLHKKSWNLRNCGPTIIYYRGDPRLPDRAAHVRAVSTRKTEIGHFWVHFWVLFLDFDISESIFGKLRIFWWNLRQTLQIFLLVVLFQRSVIWHALGQGPANSFVSDPN